MSERPASRPKIESTQVLVDLVLDPRDPAYEAAAARRVASGGTRAAHGRFDRSALAIGCVVVGFLLAVAYVHTNRAAPAALKVHDDLVTRVRSAQQGADGLADEVQSLSARLDRAQADALPGGGVSSDLAGLQFAAGAIAATGPGVEVTLSEPQAALPTGVTGRAGSTPIQQGHILTDRDVRSVVNELWADGAEAVAVNGIRLTPTSAIRFAGEAVLVDFIPLTSPYTVMAIGNENTLITSFAASDVASRYQTLASARGIGFGFTDRSVITLPASPAPIVRYAHAVTGGGR